MSRPYSNEERRARLKIFMRRNKIRTTELAKQTGYSLGYLSTALGSTGVYLPIRIVLEEAGIPEELLPPPKPRKPRKQRRRCAQNDKKICNSQAQ